MTNYMPIVPVGLLNVLDTMECSNVFMLSHLWKIPAYKKFYLDHHFDTVILDNDLYEKDKGASFDDMMTIARQIHARQIFVVGPEDLTDGIETGRKTLEILDEYGTEGVLGENINLMCILHERPNEMLEQWNMVRKYRDLAIGISIFSYRLGFDRASLYRFLDLPGDRYVHAFGWDNLLEMYNMQGCFDSIDSSMAVSAAINNVKLTKQWQITRDPKKDGRRIDDRLPLDWTNNGPIPISETGMTSLEMNICKNISFLTKFCEEGGRVFTEAEICH